MKTIIRKVDTVVEEIHREMGHICGPEAMNANESVVIDDMVDATAVVAHLIVNILRYDERAWDVHAFSAALTPYLP
jgi:hypothetical protein